jgi:hypothetical protein
MSPIIYTFDLWSSSVTLIEKWGTMPLTSWIHLPVRIIWAIFHFLALRQVSAITLLRNSRTPTRYYPLKSSPVLINPIFKPSSVTCPLAPKPPVIDYPYLQITVVILSLNVRNRSCTVSIAKSWCISAKNWTLLYVRKFHGTETIFEFYWSANYSYISGQGKSSAKVLQYTGWPKPGAKLLPVAYVLYLPLSFIESIL